MIDGVSLVLLTGICVMRVFGLFSSSFVLSFGEERSGEERRGDK